MPYITVLKRIKRRHAATMPYYLEALREMKQEQEDIEQYEEEINQIINQ